MSKPTFEQLSELHEQASSGRITRENFQAFLRNPNQFLVGDDFSTRKTIQLGTGLKTVDDFCRAFKENGCCVSDWALDILKKPAFTVVSQPTTIDLVVRSVAELGFPDGATRKEIYERAAKLGLELCPAEVGPQFRLQYKD
ncbi:MAG: hypothetical protein HQ536_05000, partial [Parcubacteria group bacterium]|nr:hypothetical protein [Parcubacteria group bacterium]